MMNWIVKWGVKKYLLDIVNKALMSYNVNIDRSRAVVARYLGKVQALMRFLNALDAKLADGKLTEEEADSLCEEATQLAKDLTA